MDSLVPDKVATCCHPIAMKMSLVVMWLLVTVLSASTPYLTTYPQSAMEGAEFTLSCTTTHSGGVISAIWYRNNADIFQTSSDVNQSTSILTPNTISPQYQSVSGRVTVSSSLQQHNVTLRINSTLDQGSVWGCRSGKRFSNNVTLEITDINEGPPSTDHTRTTTPDKTAPTKSPPSTDHARTTTPDKTASTKNSTTTVRRTETQTESTKRDTSKLIYIVAGSVGGVVVVVIIVIVVLSCTLSRKREHAKEDTNGKEGRFNDDSRETVVMEDNDLYKQYADLEVDGTEHRLSAERQEVLVMEDNDMYHGFEKAESQEPAVKQQVPDVYSKVNKVTKTNNATEVQITLSIEDLYAKPNKPANGSSESSPKGSSYQNADVCSPD